MLYRKEERRALKSPLRARGGKQSGAAMVEVALMIPLLLVLVVNVVNFGVFLYDWITVVNAARSGAQYAILGTASAYNPGTPTSAAVTTLVTNETASLPKTGTVTVTLCENTAGALSPAKCSPAPAADSEGSGYTSALLTVSYTYKPFISAFNFSKLNIGLPSLPSTITAQATMRVLN